MSNIVDCQKKLIDLAKNKGFLTFDDIMDTADTHGLSVSEVDQLSEAIQLRSIIVYESAPQNNQFDEELEDYSRTDYDAIFFEIIDHSDNLQFIVDKIRELPTPQYGEISTLSLQIANGNDYARERLILIHLRLVLKIALSMSKQHQLNIEDAVSAGFIGLITAADRYDPNGFSAFQSYASLWIQQNIQRECTPTWIEYYFPSHYKEKMLRIYEKYKKHHCTSCDNGGICVNLLTEFAQSGGITVEQAKEYLTIALKQAYGKRSLEELMKIDDEGMEKLPKGLCVDDDMLFDTIYVHLLRDTIDGIICTLTEREEKVIRLRYGLDSSDYMTLEQVGGLFDITRERVRQIEVKALNKLKHP
ncbi:MAG: sigma-70 family RNA polymerase sigma factor [Ignavibacteriales bacterium]